MTIYITPMKFVSLLVLSPYTKREDTWWITTNTTLDLLH